MIDLSQFVDKGVVITLQNGRKRAGVVRCKTSSAYQSKYRYFVDNISYTQEGKWGWNFGRDTDCDIIHIELLNPKPMKKCEQVEQLEQQIKELQNEVDRLKKEEEEEKNKVLKNFNRKKALRCIKTRNRLGLTFFEWPSTPQGVDYWMDIYQGLTPFTNEAIMQLQEWVIMSYQQEFENE